MDGVEQNRPEAADEDNSSLGAFPDAQPQDKQRYPGQHGNRTQNADQRTQDLIGSFGEAHQRTDDDAADSTQAKAAQNTQHTDAQVLCHLTAGAERNEGRQHPLGRRQNTGTDQSQIGTECPDQQNSQRSNHRQEELVRTVACQHSLIFFHKITTPSVD